MLLRSFKVFSLAIQYLNIKAEARMTTFMAQFATEMRRSSAACGCWCGSDWKWLEVGVSSTGEKTGSKPSDGPPCRDHHGSPWFTVASQVLPSAAPHWCLWDPSATWGRAIGGRHGQRILIRVNHRNPGLPYQQAGNERHDGTRIHLTQRKDGNKDTIFIGPEVRILLNLGASIRSTPHRKKNTIKFVKHR
jgi:hypothetical protein